MADCTIIKYSVTIFVIVLSFQQTIMYPIWQEGMTYWCDQDQNIILVKLEPYVVICIRIQVDYVCTGWHIAVYPVHPCGNKHAQSY